MESKGWGLKVHVESSMKSKKGQYALFIGRWQPLHDGHREMFNQVLNEGGNVCIAIRECALDDSNPYNALDVFDNICMEYKDLIEAKRLRVLILPDINSVNFGRGVGYSIIEHIPPTEISQISATKIREQMRMEGKL